MEEEGAEKSMWIKRKGEGRVKSTGEEECMVGPTWALKDSIRPLPTSDFFH